MTEIVLGHENIFLEILEFPINENKYLSKFQIPKQPQCQPVYFGIWNIKNINFQKGIFTLFKLSENRFQWIAKQKQSMG